MPHHREGDSADVRCLNIEYMQNWNENFGMLRYHPGHLLQPGKTGAIVFHVKPNSIRCIDVAENRFKCKRFRVPHKKVNMIGHQAVCKNNKSCRSAPLMTI